MMNRNILAHIRSLSLFAVAVLCGSATWASYEYDYGGEAVRLYVPVTEVTPRKLRIDRMLRNEHKINLNNYVLLAVLVESDFPGNGYARLDVGKNKGPDIELLDSQSRLLAPADDRRKWSLNLSETASVTGFTAILAPRAYTSYRGNDYGYYDRDYLQDGLLLGWVWRDRHHLQRYGYHPYHYRYGSRYRHRYNDRYRQSYRPGYRHRPGFGDGAIYDHETRQRRHRDHQQRADRTERDSRRRGGRTGRERRGDPNGDRHYENPAQEPDLGGDVRAGREEERGDRKPRPPRPVMNNQQRRVIARGTSRNHEYRAGERQVLGSAPRREQRPQRQSQRAGSGAAPTLKSVKQTPCPKTSYPRTKNPTARTTSGATPASAQNAKTQDAKTKNATTKNAKA